MIIKRLGSIFLIFSAFCLALTSQTSVAQTVTLSGLVGGVGGIGSDSGIASGASININSLGWSSFYADVFFAPINSGTLLGLAPSFAFYPVDVEGFMFGGLLGVGFYKVPNESGTFGFQYGIIGDFSITKKVSVGMIARQHLLTGSGTDAFWSVMMSVGYRFEGGGEW